MASTAIREKFSQQVYESGRESAATEKLGWRKREVKEIAEALNQLIANYSVHYQKLRNYHWNVQGADFFDLHNEFEQQYEEAKLNIDEIAERIRVYERTPYSTMREYLQYSEIKETGTDIDSSEMVKEILNDYTILLDDMVKVVDIAVNNKDSGTEEMVKGFIKKLEKHHWMLSAFSGK